jgi:hypothetical protein
VIKLQAAIKYGEEDLPGAKVKNYIFKKKIEFELLMIMFRLTFSSP